MNRRIFMKLFGALPFINVSQGENSYELSELTTSDYMFIIRDFKHRYLIDLRSHFPGWNGLPYINELDVVNNITDMYWWSKEKGNDSFYKGKMVYCHSKAWANTAKDFLSNKPKNGVWDVDWILAESKDGVNIYQRITKGYLCDILMVCYVFVSKKAVAKLTLLVQNQEDLRKIKKGMKNE